ncbi:MAG: lysozyme [Magnetococcales bacterium]|nr:lysozyme [Magnetococcales bacterium]
MALLDRLIKHEAMKVELYQCPANKWTIGVGRNVEEVGISNEELIWLFQNEGFIGGTGVHPCGLSRAGAMYLLASDVNRVIVELREKVPGFDQLIEARKQALVDMCFNLGLSRFLRFKKLLAALANQDYDRAAEEMLDSRWAKQVGRRATALATMMQNGSY